MTPPPRAAARLLVALAACSPPPKDPADDTDVADTDVAADTDRPLPLGERVVHADGGVFDTTGDYQAILRDPYVCYVIQILDDASVYNIVALGLEQRLRHVLGESYRAILPFKSEDLNNSNIDLRYDGRVLLVAGVGGARAIDVVTGEMTLLSDTEALSVAWMGDRVVIDDLVFASMDDARAGIVADHRGRGPLQIAGYGAQLFSLDGWDVTRETLSPWSQRRSHVMPRDVRDGARGVTQFDVLGDVVVTWLIRDDFAELLTWYDGRAVRTLGAWDPMLSGDAQRVACLPGAP